MYLFIYLMNHTFYLILYLLFKTETIQFPNAPYKFRYGLYRS